MSQAPLYKRVLLKLSGEALMGDREYGLDTDTVAAIAHDIGDVAAMGVQVSVVIGGGNIFRGVSGASKGMDRAQADYMGMLATVMNALAMQNALERVGVTTRVQSAIPMASVCEPYIRRRAACGTMEKGRVVIFGAGTGNPFFTTDTAAALRAAEMGCDALLKGTQVDERSPIPPDPRKVAGATRCMTNFTYHDVLARDLRVMDAAAISLSRENRLPIIVFNIHASGAFAQVMRGEGRFTRIVEADSRSEQRVRRHRDAGRDEMAADLTILKDDLTRRMDGALETLRREFSGLRTGRAHPGLLEPVKVTAYGQEMPLNQVGTIGAPEARMLTVQVWDKSMVSAVEKAIRDSGLGLNPSSDGMLVRIPIPQLTTERRAELARTAHKYAEGARISVRGVRRDGMEQVKGFEKKHEIGEDLAKGFQSRRGAKTHRPFAVKGRRVALG